jgi:hypothetical protein
MIDPFHPPTSKHVFHIENCCFLSFFYEKPGIDGYNKGMSTLFSDTNPKAEAVLIQLLRQAPPWRKLEMVAELNEAVLTMMRCGFVERFPNDSPALIKRRMADMLLGVDLASKVYGPLSQEHDAVI